MAGSGRVGLLHRSAAQEFLATPALEHWQSGPIRRSGLMPESTERFLTSGGEVQQSRRVLEIYLFQNCRWQFDAVNLPSSLRRNFCRSVIKVLIVGLEEAVINFV